MSFCRGFLISCCLLLGVLSGCSGLDPESSADESSSAQPRSATRDSAIALVQNARSDALREAFERRSEINYFRRSRTEQIDPTTERSIAWQETLIEHIPSKAANPEIVEVDSSGQFRLGFPASLIRPTPSLDTLNNPVPHVLPDDPAYLSERGLTLYQYELLGDTVMAGRPTSVARVVLEPGARGEQEIQTARFYIDQSSGELVGLFMHRRQDALLFTEESTFEIYIQPLTSDTWFPERTSMRTVVDIPFVSAKLLETKAEYFTQPPGG